MTSVLVLTALDVEARGLARELGLSPVAGSDWPHFRSGVLEVAGIGLAASRLGARAGAFRGPTLVVSAGVCGALAPDLRVGDLVVPETVITLDGLRHATTRLAGLPPTGTLLTVREVIASTRAKARLWLETGAMAVDMESAPVLSWAAARAVPAAVVRGVSDAATDAVPAALAGVVDGDGRVRGTSAFRVALARPWTIPLALALQHGTAAALRAVAAALGELARA